MDRIASMLPGLIQELESFQRVLSELAIEEFELRKIESALEARSAHPASFPDLAKKRAQVSALKEAAAHLHSRLSGRVEQRQRDLFDHMPTFH
ncbi:hypothetical protein [Undibacterium squillarum]|uniref:Uncharacterized protein n=1 Tax=Undibacterium squillarum TaxID=1131567 RepID=A0ABQ2XVS1_9BURK|nr:hypothetical protein [Undibacterium squillarum]GGX35311.1 hypothetical protein GCM10010946_10880 [Undibacterium squillarum]